MKCYICGCVGLTQEDVDCSDEIVGPGYDTMCEECAKSFKDMNEERFNSIKNYLLLFGSSFYGHSSDIGKVAKEWYEIKLDTDIIKAYMNLGCWNPDLAEDLWRMDFSPSLLEKILPQMDEEAPNGDHMYSMCNNDMTIEEFKNHAQISGLID